MRGGRTKLQGVDEAIQFWSKFECNLRFIETQILLCQTHPAGHSALLISSHSSCTHEVSPQGGEGRGTQEDTVTTTLLSTVVVPSRGRDEYLCRATCSWSSSLPSPDSPRSSGTHGRCSSPRHSDPASTRTLRLPHREKQLSLYRFTLPQLTKKNPMAQKTNQYNKVWRLKDAASPAVWNKLFTPGGS